MVERELEARLIDLVSATPWVVRVLEAARAVGAPDWLVAAGVIRNLVWDHLHDFSNATPLKDVDLIFFDRARLREQAEQKVRDALLEQTPDVPWDAKNQAAVHLWYPRVFGIEVGPLVSSADAVGTFPETATAVAVRLDADDRVEVVAPMGLADLFALVCRRNPRRVTEEEYRRRVRDKRIAERWPLVKIVE